MKYFGYGLYLACRRQCAAGRRAVSKVSLDRMRVHQTRISEGPAEVDNSAFINRLVRTCIHCRSHVVDRYGESWLTLAESRAYCALRGFKLRKCCNNGLDLV